VRVRVLQGGIKGMGGFGRGIEGIEGLLPLNLDITTELGI
jgi:hypothetical protein